MEIRPRLQDTLPILPEILSPEDITQGIQALKKIKNSFENRRGMFFYRKTTQYMRAQETSLQRIGALNAKKVIFEQRIKDRNDRERIEGMSAHEKVAILIMFLKKDIAAQLLQKMTEQEVQAVTLLMATMDRPTRAMIEHVFHSFITDIHKTASP